MKKTRFIALTLVIMAILGTFCSCGSQEEAAPEILPEIVKAYDLDKEGKALITGLFEDFDSAFAALAKNDKIGDADLSDYANAVTDAFGKFADTFGEYYERLTEKCQTITDENEKEDLLLALNGYVPIISSHSSLLFRKLDALKGSISGEAFAESAFDLVNEVSTYFYGKDWITDEDLDSLVLE